MSLIEMNKTTLRNFAIEARNKLREEVTLKAKLAGITEAGVSEPTQEIEGGVLRFSDVANAPLFCGKELKQREALVAELKLREKTTGEPFAIVFDNIVEEVAYTWFNRIIALRFMEVNDYLPDRTRVLSSESRSTDPDIVREFANMDALAITPEEKEALIQLRLAGDIPSMNALYQQLFIKQCNALNEILPHLFEEIEDWTELLFAASYSDQDGVIARLIRDIPESYFRVEEGGQVEIIGWLYQYYNTEPKDKVFDRGRRKIRADEIPAATQLFTPEWIVRYMVENSLGRFYIDQKLADERETRTEKEIAEQFGWKYYLPQAEQPEDVRIQIEAERAERSVTTLTQLKFIDIILQRLIQFNYPKSYCA